MEELNMTYNAINTNNVKPEMWTKIPHVSKTPIFDMQI